MIADYFAYETQGFLLMCACGFVCSFIYRMLNLIYKETNLKNDLTDILYYILVTSCCAFSVMVCWYYHNMLMMRYYMFLGLFLGAVIYFLSADWVVKPIFSVIFEKIFKIMQIFLKILLTPARFLHKIIVVLFNRMIRCIGIIKMGVKSRIGRIANENKFRKHKSPKRQKKYFWQYVGIRRGMSCCIADNGSAGNSRSA